MKQNLYYKHACLTKLALTISLLFVALWFFLFSSLSFGNPESVTVYSVVDTGYTLSGNEEARHRGDTSNNAKSPAQNSLASQH